MTQTKLHANDSAEILKAATQLAQSEVLGEQADATMAGVITKAPSYNQWELIRREFETDYSAARKCSGDAANKAWGRLVARLKARYELTKPSAPTVAATKKAESRKAEKTERLDVHAQYCPRATTAQEVKTVMLAKGADMPADHLAKLAKVAENLAKGEAKAAEKSQNEKLAEARDACRKAINACTDLEVLARILMLAKGEEVAPTKKARKAA